MANLPSTKRNLRKLSKIGGFSYAVTIPIEQIRKLGWKLGQKLILEKKGETVVIKDWKKNP